MGRKHKILSIDDSKAVHAFIDRSLVGTDFEMVHAMDGAAGFEIARSEGDRVSLILLDWEMPEKNGPEVLTEIRNAGVLTPVIMLTSKNDPKDIQRMLQLGANEYIMKPFTPDILISKMSAILGIS